MRKGSTLDLYFPSCNPFIILVKHLGCWHRVQERCVVHPCRGQHCFMGAFQDKPRVWNGRNRFVARSMAHCQFNHAVPTPKQRVSLVHQGMASVKCVVAFPLTMTSPSFRLILVKYFHSDPSTNRKQPSVNTCSHKKNQPRSRSIQMLPKSIRHSTTN